MFRYERPQKGRQRQFHQVGVEMFEIKLNNKTQAFDFKWKQLAAPGGKVVMFTESKDVKTGDKVVIEDGTLCIKRDKSPLNCNIILCSL